MLQPVKALHIAKAEHRIASLLEPVYGGPRVNSGSHLSPKKSHSRCDSIHERFCARGPREFPGHGRLSSVFPVMPRIDLDLGHGLEFISSTIRNASPRPLKLLLSPRPCPTLPHEDKLGSHGDNHFSDHPATTNTTSVVRSSRMFLPEDLESSRASPRHRSMRIIP